jgi:hypothetical protein
MGRALPKLAVFAPITLIEDADLVVKGSSIFSELKDQLTDCCLVSNNVVVPNWEGAYSIPTINEIEDELLILPSIPRFAIQDSISKTALIAIKSFCGRRITPPFPGQGIIGIVHKHCQSMADSRISKQVTPRLTRDSDMLLRILISDSVEDCCISTDSLAA